MSPVSTRKPTAPLPVKSFVSAAAWDGWLLKNHARSKGLWVKLAKKDAKVRSVTYPEAVLVALTWGWIDGQARRVDDRFWMQRFSPRGPRSIWSKLNRQRVAKLVREGRMKPAGLEAVRMAKKNGQWANAYDPPSTAKIPEELVKALAKSEVARKAFAALDGRNRYAVVWRIQTAKKQETRTKRSADLVAMLERGEVLHRRRTK